MEPIFRFLEMSKKCDKVLKEKKSFDSDFFFCDRSIILRLENRCHDNSRDVFFPELLFAFPFKKRQKCIHSLHFSRDLLI